jgi:hypothetical protein
MSTTRITMVKKLHADGLDCRKCAEATDYLASRGLWDRIDDVIWADENDPESPGMQLSRRFGVDRVPFFVIEEAAGETVYTSVLQLVRERLGRTITTAEELQAIDPDDIGGI